MKLIDWKELSQRVPYSRQHILRLEKAGRFPLRVRIGDHRIAWVADEVDAWVQSHIDKRGS